jgi:hypothetical protein
MTNESTDDEQFKGVKNVVNVGGRPKEDVITIIGE